MTSLININPGSFYIFTLDKYDPSSQWPQSRCFSIQSAPGSDTIKITYAVKGSFTTRMEKQLKQGSEITLKLPFGDLFLQEHSRNNTVFISGGTGITPFLSLFNNSSFSNYTNPVLYAGFRCYSFNIYEEELELALKINPGIKIIPVYQDVKGNLDIAKILSQNSADATFFISGPPEMINSFKRYLIKNSVTSYQILTDDWE